MSLPFFKASRLNINSKDKVAIVIAHPDDELLMMELLVYLC
jgi:hypothetical protein